MLRSGLYVDNFERIMSRSLTFAFALDASSREVRNVRFAFVFRIFFGSRSMQRLVLRMAIRLLRTYFAFDSSIYVLISLARIFLAITYTAITFAFIANSVDSTARSYRWML